MRHISGVAFFLILVLNCALFMGCDTNKNPSPKETKTEVSKDTVQSPAKKQVLHFRITWKAYSGRGQAVQKIVDAYNAKEQTLYQVEIIDGDENLSNTQTALSGEDQVDVCAMPYRYVKTFGYEGQLEDLTDAFSSSRSIFYPNLWSLGTISGKVYGIPWMGHSMGLIYNKDILDLAGVNPDEIRNLNDLLEACRMVEIKTEAHGIGLVGADHNDLSWMVNQFIYAFGGQLVDETGTKVVINSKEAADAIHFYVDSLGSFAQDSWKNDTGMEVMNHFREQKVAFEIQGLWGVTDIWKSGNPFEVGVIPLERIDVPPEVGPIMLTIPDSLEESQRMAAIDFIDYLISIEAQEMILDGEYSPEHDRFYPFRLPVRNDIGNHLVFRGKKDLSAFLTGFENPSIDVPTPQWQGIKDDIFTPALHKVILDQMSVEEFLLQVEEQGNISIEKDLRGTK